MFGQFNPQPEPPDRWGRMAIDRRRNAIERRRKARLRAIERRRRGYHYRSAPRTVPPGIRRGFYWRPGMTGFGQEPDSVMGRWWAGRSTLEKAAVVGAGALFAFFVVGAVVKRKRYVGGKPLSSNPRGRAKAKRRRAKATRAAKARESKRAKRRRRKGRVTCKAIPAVPSCRCEPPAKYRKLGATRASDYALPECFMYPLHMRSVKQSKIHTRNAASRFGRIMKSAKLRNRYPAWSRKKIAKRIEAAKRKYHIGAYRVAA